MNMAKPYSAVVTSIMQNPVLLKAPHVGEFALDVGAVLLENGGLLLLILLHVGAAAG